jgi:UDP-glucose 4-epimerase
VAGAYTRSDRAERLLGWRARYSVEEGIGHSLEWARLRDSRLKG